MNARNDLEQYLRPGKFRFIAGVAGCVIAAALALLGVLINAGIVVAQQVRLMPCPLAL